MQERADICWSAWRSGYIVTKGVRDAKQIGHPDCDPNVGASRTMIVSLSCFKCLDITDCAIWDHPNRWTSEGVVFLLSCALCCIIQSKALIDSERDRSVNE